VICIDYIKEYLIEQERTKSCCKVWGNAI